jgi:hypothetical protein
MGGSGSGRGSPDPRRRPCSSEPSRCASTCQSRACRSPPLTGAAGCASGPSSTCSTWTCRTSPSRAPGRTSVWRASWDGRGPGAARRVGLGGLDHRWLEGRTVAFEYEATYTGSRSFHAKEVRLVRRRASPSATSTRRRMGSGACTGGPRRTDVGHRGRAPANTRSIRPRPGSRMPPRPAATTIGARSGGSRRRRDRWRAVAHGPVRRDQHVRAELVDGSPVLHVLDWYGGVRTLDGNHPIWSAYLGSGLPITRGTTLRGRIVLAATERP